MGTEGELALLCLLSELQGQDSVTKMQCCVKNVPECHAH